MQQTKRKHKRENRKRNIKILTGFGIIFILIASCAFAYFNYIKKPIYISPLPPSYKINSVTDRDEKLDLLKKELKEKKIVYKSISKHYMYFIVNFEDKSRVLISQQKDMVAQTASLQLILSKLTMEGKSFSELDLRFDKPVIRIK